MLTEPIKFYKTVVSLPNVLEPNTMYAVRIGAGFDFYLSDMTGAIAYKMNTEAGSGSGSSTGIIKTFNILNEFTAPLLGNSIFVPTSNTIIRSLQITNGKRVTTDLMLGLYRNSELLGFYIITNGQYTAKYTGLSHTIRTDDYLTVNVVAGSGINLSMILLDTNG
jgi:hypothetical protein